MTGPSGGGAQEGLRRVLGQLAPLVQSRTLLQGPEDLQEAKLSNEVGAALPRPAPLPPSRLRPPRWT